jgi:hypothetical protein
LRFSQATGHRRSAGNACVRRPVFACNRFDLRRYFWSGSSIDAGKHTLVFDFKYDWPGPGKNGKTCVKGANNAGCTK